MAYTEEDWDKVQSENINGPEDMEDPKINQCDNCDARGGFFDISFKQARKRMGKGLKENGLRSTYIANIAMCIYDNRRPDGRLNHKNCNEVAEKLIKLIWD